jgi:glycosyltransferase involved in cell wall biosynthesis
MHGARALACACALACALPPLLAAEPTPAPPLTVLFETWLHVPHSYAIVSSFELAALLQAYGPAGEVSPGAVEVFVSEAPLYKPHWAALRAPLFAPGSAHAAQLAGARPYDGRRVDVVYRRAFPHDVSRPGGGAALVVGATAEFGAKGTPPHNFVVDADGAPARSVAAARAALRAARATLLTPSAWSARGLARYAPSPAAVRVLPHAADATLFRRLPRAARAAQRARFGLPRTAFLLLSVGAMSPNKGICDLLAALELLVHAHAITEAVLLLKAPGLLYGNGATAVQACFVQLEVGAAAAAGGDGGGYAARLRAVAQRHVLFQGDEATSFEALNALYNAADVYVAPFRAEAFALTPLEALRAGAHVVAPAAGGAAEYLAVAAAAAPRRVSLLRGGGGMEVTPDGEQLRVIDRVELSGVLAARARAHRTATAHAEVEEDDDEAWRREHAALQAALDVRFSWRAVADGLLDVLREAAAATRSSERDEL